MIETINQMIEEQGEAWLATGADRSDLFQAVVVTDNPDHCYRLVFRDGQWLTLEDKLTSDEIGDFFAAFGSHWRMLMGARLATSGGPHDVRAFIKNGRKRSQEWSISIISAEEGKRLFDLRCSQRITDAFESVGLERVA